MEGIEKVAVVAKDPENSWEGLRSTLGLLVDNLWAAFFLLDTEVVLPADKTEEDFKENLEMCDDTEGLMFTNVQANVDKWGYFTYLDMDGVIEKMREYQIIMPF
jgi:hypothetical protein